MDPINTDFVVTPVMSPSSLILDRIRHHSLDLKSRPGYITENMSSFTWPKLDDHMIYCKSPTRNVSTASIITFANGMSHCDSLYESSHNMERVLQPGIQALNKDAMFISTYKNDFVPFPPVVYYS